MRLSLIAAALAATAHLAGAQGASRQDTVARVDSIFSQFTTSTPGCTMGVSRHGRTVLAKAYGMSNLEYDVPLTTESIIEAGSVAKQFTAAAILLLAQQGKLSIDDRVRKHIPELPDYGAPLTIRHMLNHTSGLRDWGTVAAVEGWPRGSRVHTHDHVLDIIARQRSLNFPPGSEYLYSNSGYNLLAIIVQRVSGQPFADFTRSAIFEPLGMTRTSWRDDYTRIVKGRATAYSPTRGGFRLNMPFENVHGNGGLLTTVEDLLRWSANFDAGHVGGPALLREQVRPGRLTSGREIEYAAGLSVSRYRGVPEVSHSGATAGYRAFLTRYPDQGLTVAVLCNHAGAGRRRPRAPGRGHLPGRRRIESRGADRGRRRADRPGCAGRLVSERGHGRAAAHLGARREARGRGRYGGGPAVPHPLSEHQRRPCPVRGVAGGPDEDAAPAPGGWRHAALSSRRAVHTDA